jgi:hypothetical protein
MLRSTEYSSCSILFVRNPKGSGRVQVKALHLPACSEKPHFVAENDLYLCPGSNRTQGGIFNLLRQLVLSTESLTRQCHRR